MPSANPSTTSQPSGSPNQEFLPAPCVLVVNGPPGVGKTTITKAVSEKLGQYDRPHRLIENHLLIELAAAIEPIWNSNHHEMRK